MDCVQQVEISCSSMELHKGDLHVLSPDYKCEDHVSSKVSVTKSSSTDYRLRRLFRVGALFFKLRTVHLVELDKEEEEDLFVQRQNTISYGSWLYIYTHIDHMFTLILEIQ